MLPVYSYDQIAYQLTDLGQQYFGGGLQKFAISAGGTLTYNVTGLNDAGREFARTALDVWTLATGINFVETTSSASITFNHGRTAGDAYTQITSDSSGTILYTSISISREWIQYDWSRANDGTVDVDYSSYSMLTYVHEIGHALGLAHGGNYNGSATYSRDATYANDSWQASIMSYFDQSENTYIDASFAYVITPMIADMVAIHNLYGTPTTGTSGNTTYGYHGNTNTYLDDLSVMQNPVAFTIFDTSGTDTIDLSFDRYNQWVDLNAEGISDVLGLDGNLIIARDSVIENFNAGLGNDTIYGNSADNEIFGNAGNDSLFGGSGNDVLIDGLGNNDLVGGDGYDIIAAYSGLNTLTGGAANDFITGGINADIIDAGSGNDVIIGDAGRNIYGSSDQIEGGTGNDTMMGGNGADTFVFHPNDGNDVIADFIAPDVSRNSAGTLSVASFGEDFQSGLDEIHLIGFQSVGSNNVMSFMTDTAQGAKFQAEGTTILFYGVATSDLSVDDFVFV
jgi:serralysin